MKKFLSSLGKLIIKVIFPIIITPIIMAFASPIITIIIWIINPDFDYTNSNFIMYYTLFSLVIAIFYSFYKNTINKK